MSVARTLAHRINIKVEKESVGFTISANEALRIIILSGTITVLSFCCDNELATTH